MTHEANNTARCAYCERDSEQAPLIAMKYRNADLWICTEHLPTLLHQPAKLAEKLPGVDQIPLAKLDD